MPPQHALTRAATGLALPHLALGALTVLAVSMVNCGGEANGDESASGGQLATGGESAVGGGGPGTGGSGGSGGEPGCVDDPVAGACLAPIACAVDQGPFGGGDGTEQAPFAICTTAHLLAVDDEATGTGKFFVLAASLDLSGLSNFVPLGVRVGTNDGTAAAFEGTFDGAGRVLRGLTIDLPDENYIGLFGWVYPGSLIRDLRLVDFTMRGGASVGLLAGRNAGDLVSIHTSGVVEAEDTAGGITGFNFGSIARSSSSAAVTSTGVQAGGIAGTSEGDLTECESSGPIFGDLAVGGLLGQTTGAVIDCRSSSNVEGDAQVGGLVGQVNGGSVLRGEASGTVLGTAELDNSGRSLGGLIGTTMATSVTVTVVSSRATGAVRGSDEVGGLIGSSWRTNVEDCEASGTVQGTTEVGGLAGSARETIIMTSRASGAVSGVSTVGGLIGALEAGVHTSCATGDVTSTENIVGGLVGRMGGPAGITGAYSVGQVTGNGDVGGLVGGGTVGEISQSYAFGVATGTPPIGGLVGTANLDPDDSVGSVSSTACYYREESPGSAPPEGTPLSLAAFGDAASFEGWDFASTWVMSEALGRPVLWWE